MNRVLYFEPGVGGHRADYLSAILGANPHGSWVMAISPKLLDQLPPDHAEILKSASNKDFLHIPLDIQPALASSPALAWKRSMELAREHACSAVFYPLLDDLIYSSFRYPSSRDIKICGIYFRPTMHYKPRSYGEQIKYFAKKFGIS